MGGWGEIDTNRFISTCAKTRHFQIVLVVVQVSGTYAISMSAYTHLDRREENMINLLK